MISRFVMIIDCYYIITDSIMEITYKQNSEKYEDSVHCLNGKSIMMTSYNGSIFRVTGPLCGEQTGHRWIPFTKASGVKLSCFIWSAPEQTVEWKIETPVIWDVIVLIMTLLQCDSGLGRNGCFIYFYNAIL